MDNKRRQTYVQFNDRTLFEFIDDNQKRMNAYVLPRSSQGKETWQSNFATQSYKNKTKALLASTSRNLPDMKFKAVNENDEFDHFAAEVTKKLVMHSYVQGNPQEELFFLAWSNVVNGTVLSYEGFEKQNFVKKRIKSYDVVTGAVEEEDVERVSEGEPVTYEIQPSNFLIKNFFIRDVQEQPAIIIEEYYAERERFDAVYGQFKNAQFVRNIADIRKDETRTYFHELWKETVGQEIGFMVLRYMNKYRDVYRIVVNGVEIYNGPMIWADITRKYQGKKSYPVAKTIFEPFANGDFFWGNSMVNSAMGYGDTLNTLFNSSLDKQYRKLVPPLLVGMVNKDMLDLEDELLAGDTKIYVEDVKQVEQLQMDGITQSDVQMIDLVGRELDITTLDPQQQGAAQKYVTARAAVAADERARELKGIFFMFMESLWLQKIRLRIPNLLIAYTQPRVVEMVGEEEAGKLFERARNFNVKNTRLSDGTKGTTSIEFVPQQQFNDEKEDIRGRVEAEEERNFLEGEPLEKIVMPYGYLDGLSFDIELMSETLWKSSTAVNMALVIEKIQIVSRAFPEIFAQNKQVFFEDLLKAYQDDPSKYDSEKTLGFEEQEALKLAGGQAGGGGNSQRVSDLTGTDTNNRLGGVAEG